MIGFVGFTAFVIVRLPFLVIRTVKITIKYVKKREVPEFGSRKRIPSKGSIYFLNLKRILLFIFLIVFFLFRSWRMGWLRKGISNLAPKILNLIFPIAPAFYNFLKFEFWRQIWKLVWLVKFWEFGNCFPTNNYFSFLSFYSVFFFFFTGKAGNF